MAFVIRNLSVCGYCNGFTQWHYKTNADTIEVVDGKDYFVDAADMLSRNDVIIVCANDSVTQRYVVFAGIEHVGIAPLKM